MNINLDIKYQLKEALALRQKITLRDNTRKPSAVLIPIYFWQGQNYILFTRRTELVRYHKGEISFPGGGYHKVDGSLVQTALRESFEEIGLIPSDVEVLGELDDVPTRYSNYIITPFVGAIRPQYKFKLSDFETAELIQIPISGLLAKGCFHEEPVIDLTSQTAVPFVYAYEGKLITGATARILKQFLDIISL